MRTLPSLALLVALCAAGCWRPSAVGYWTEDAYYPARSHYRVFYTDDERILLSGWTATAFARENGRPTTALGNVWSHTRAVEYDPGDTGRPARVIEERSDLSLSHTDGSRIEAWTEPLTPREAGFDLGEMVVALATLTARDHPLDLSIAEHARVTVDGVEGHQVFFEVRHSQPVAAGITLIPTRNVLIVVRPSRRWVPGGSTANEHDGMPMAVFFFLSASADVFDARYAELEALLARVDFR